MNLLIAQTANSVLSYLCQPYIHGGILCDSTQTAMHYALLNVLAESQRHSVTALSKLSRGIVGVSFFISKRYTAFDSLAAQF
jgi:hypothetical protein